VLVNIPKYNLDSGNAYKIRNGQCVPIKLLLKNNTKLVIKNGNNFLALCSYFDGVLKPIKIF